MAKQGGFMPPRLIERVLGNLAYFERLILGPSIRTVGDGELDELVGGRPERLFLGIYTEESLAERLEALGLLPKLRAKGLTDIRLQLTTSDPEHQLMRVFSTVDDDEHLLCEAIYHPGEFRTRAPFAKLLHGYRFRMLYIQWMLLQNPFREFTADRPQLPGPHFPGLRVGREVVAALQVMVERLEYDGILVTPEFGHNALMYMPLFQFVNPDSQGQMLALRRDLAGLSLAEAAWGAEMGCIANEATGEIFRWFHNEMCLSRRRRIKAYFKSEAYEKRVKQAMDKARFVFDRALYEERFPMRESFLARERTIAPDEVEESDD